MAPQIASPARAASGAEAEIRIRPRPAAARLRISMNRSAMPDLPGLVARVRLSAPAVARTKANHQRAAVTPTKGHAAMAMAMAARASWTVLADRRRQARRRRRSPSSKTPESGRRVSIASLSRSLDPPTFACAASLLRNDEEMICRPGGVHSFRLRRFWLARRGCPGSWKFSQADLRPDRAQRDRFHPSR
jgi:hypothetical protein